MKAFEMSNEVGTVTKLNYLIFQNFVFFNDINKSTTIFHY